MGREAMTARTGIGRRRVCTTRLFCTAVATLIGGLALVAPIDAFAHGNANATKATQNIATQAVAAPATVTRAASIESVPSQATPTAGRTDDAPVSVRLYRESVTSEGHVFVAEVADSENNLIIGATVDIGGLGDDPDLRVPTRAMMSSGKAYRATLDFSHDGSWVLVVRVQAPVQAVELFTVEVLGTSEAQYARPSRTLYQALTRTTDSHGSQMSATETASLENHVATDGFDLGGVLAILVHSVGALAWLSATLCLAFVGRIGPGADRLRITTMITRRYSLLALGGLGLLLATGFTNIDRSSPGLTTPSELLTSTLGRMYFGLFLFKMFLVVATIVTTWKIRELLPTQVSLTRHATLASVGAQANEDIPDGTGPVLFRLAEVNALLGVAIIGIVALLNQLHHAIH